MHVKPFILSRVLSFLGERQPVATPAPREETVNRTEVAFKVRSCSGGPGMHCSAEGRSRFSCHATAALPRPFTLPFFPVENCMSGPNSLREGDISLPATPPPSDKSHIMVSSISWNAKYHSRSLEDATYPYRGGRAATRSSPPIFFCEVAC